MTSQPSGYSIPIHQKFTLEERELYLAAFQTSEDYPPDDLGKIKFLPDTWVKDALTHEMPTIRKTEETFSPIASHYNFPLDYSAAAAPLHTGDEILGMLTLLHHTTGRYGTETQKIISAFASYAAVAIRTPAYSKPLRSRPGFPQSCFRWPGHTDPDKSGRTRRTIVRLTPMVAGIKGCGLL